MEFKAMIVTICIALLWLFLALQVRKSIHRSQKIPKLIVLCGALAGANLILFVGSLIGLFFRLTFELYNTVLPSINPVNPAGNVDFSNEIIIEIHDDQTLAVNDAPVALDKLAEALKSQLRAGSANPVTLVTSPGASYATTKKVLDICSQLHLENVSFMASGE